MIFILVKSKKIDFLDYTYFTWINGACSDFAMKFIEAISTWVWNSSSNYWKNGIIFMKMQKFCTRNWCITFQRSSLKGYSQGKEKNCEKKILENFEKVLENSKIFSFEYQTGERI